jgi:predicted ATPase/DNA-binding XRE family transcriptional regulator
MGDDTFGNLLRRYRLTAGLSQEELAERADLSVRGIGDLERGRRTMPRPRTVASLADALDLQGPDRQALFAHARPDMMRALPSTRGPLGPPAHAAIPIPPTRMLGRDDMLATLSPLLQRTDTRLLTLTGPGGVGKTLLASTLARTIASRFDDGVVFVDLSAVNHSQGVGPALLRALAADDDRTGDITGRLRHAAQHLEALIVLDNCEHVLSAMPLVASMLAAAPSLKILATSRERLHLRGEREIAVPPLSLPVRGPGQDSMPGSEALARSPAIQLFIERAGEARAGFTLIEGDVPAILAICERLDALPLAIELAAARIRHLSPAAILRKLDERLIELGDGPRDLPARHRALSATVSWSYDLLTPLEQSIFRHVAVFVGGFTLAAAEAITFEGVFGVLGSLMDKGLLLHTIHDQGESRFRMLETVRDFGRERLEGHSESSSIRNVHARYFLDLAEGIEATIHQDPFGDAIDHIESESGNLQAALDWTIQQHDKERALRLASALWPFWRRRYYSGIGRGAFQRAFAINGPVTPNVEAKALLASGSLDWVHGDFDRAEPCLERALRLYRGIGNLSGAGDAELALGRLRWDRGLQHKAREHFTRAMRQFDGGEDHIRLAHALHGLGLVYYKDRLQEQSRTSFLEALRLWSSHDLSWGLACCIPGHLGDVARASEDIPGAISHYTDCVQRNWEHRDYENVSWCCIGLAATFSTTGPAGSVAWLLGVADRLQDLVHAPLMPDVRDMYELASAFAHNALGDEQFRVIKRQGRESDPAASVGEIVTNWRPSSPRDQAS